MAFFDAVEHGGRRILVVGASGLVGGALLRALGTTGVGTYLRRPRPGLLRLDAADRDTVARLLAEVRPDSVLFPAAEPGVDWCEEHPEEAREKNTRPALTTLSAALDVGAHFVFFSTDYVFDGAEGPYMEDDRPAPLQVYGRIKLDIEKAVLGAGETVLRTTTVFGEEAPPPKNFAVHLVERLRARERVRVPNDQISTPTWVDDLARASLAVAGRAGVWHAAGPRLVSRDEFARLIATTFDLEPDLIEGVTTEELAQRAPRPLRGGLRTEKIATLLHEPFLPPDEALVLLRRRSTR
ncbi:MAG: SDR family oxidoreductase [Chloroflexota bacterium]|nr:SDR family oxidoreductase [Chloroflexota bacterium]